MPTQDYRDLAVDNFIFRIKNGLWYSRTGAWVAVDTAASVARVGLSDFYQQSSGGIVFVELLPVGTAVVQDTEFAHLETTNGDREVPSPATGSILRANPCWPMPQNHQPRPVWGRLAGRRASGQLGERPGQFARRRGLLRGVAA